MSPLLRPRSPPPPPRLLRELELLTLEESLLGEGASLLGLCRRELTGSSHPLRFPKVMRALRMWKMGISAGKGLPGQGPLQPTVGDPASAGGLD